jgi:hypothetical protein
MSAYKSEQRRLSHRGRMFHFVSYEGRPANAKKNERAEAPAWFLMGPARRWRVMPQVVDQPEAETETRLIAWLERNVFSPEGPPA